MKVEKKVGIKAVNLVDKSVAMMAEYLVSLKALKMVERWALWMVAWTVVWKVDEKVALRDVC